MKRIILLVVFSVALIRGNCQFEEYITFDNPTNLFRIRIDTTIPNNIWQIGKPNKHLFHDAYSIPNGIVTDTVNSYPINNNSVFYLITPGDFHGKSHTGNLDFWYRIDSDSLLDWGKVEVSVGSSHTWKNIVSGNGVHGLFWVYDTAGNIIRQTGTDTIVFTGSSHGWYKLLFYQNFNDNEVIDSIRYRFTFHSSNSFASRDGWIIDNIGFVDYWESAFNKQEEFNIYPNPVPDYMNINCGNKINAYEIMNSTGQVLDRRTVVTSSLHIDVSGLVSGFYLYKLQFINGQQVIGKFVKN